MIDWTELERQGRIQPSPGREEAVQATMQAIAEKKAKAEQERLEKSQRKSRKHKS